MLHMCDEHWHTYFLRYLHESHPRALEVTTYIAPRDYATGLVFYKH